MLATVEARHGTEFTVPPASGTDMVRRRLAELIERDRWTRQQLLAYQQERLRAVLRHAISSSEFYRDTIGHLVAQDAPFEEYPVLTKGQLVANFDRIVTDSRLNLAEIERHLAGEQAGDLLFGEYRTCATGGTTGVRAVMAYDQPTWEYVAANALRSNRLAGASREARTVGIGAPTPHHLSCRLFDELRPDSGVPRLNVTMPMDEVVRALNEFQPDVISTYPSFIRRLAEEQLEGRLGISTRRFCSVAEALTPDVRDLARQAWDAKIFDRYSTTETACSGSECEHQCGIHLPEDLVLFEAVDDSNHRVPNGSAGRRLLVTTLASAPVPLVRYEFSDIVTLEDGRCACGRPHARMTSIDGRREEILQLPRNGGGRVAIHAFRLLSPLTSMPGVRQYQLLHDTNDIEVRICVRNGESPHEIASSVERKIKSVLVASDAGNTKLAVEIVDSIERSGTGAKQRLVAKAEPKEPHHA